MTFFCTFSASSVSVRLGSSNHASGGEVIDVAQVIPHPNYDDFDISNDACILILENTPTNSSSE
jgi:trypsin